ncbi:TetR family transcriptional regulator [bacterium]|nr:TetR family transcriptional regulator [bacterium]
MTIEQIEAKQRIFDAALRLFAMKGYSAVGVREIAREADVNISMISYYYGGKVGILRVIIEQFFDSYKQILKEIKGQNTSVEDSIYSIVASMVQFLKENPELCMVAFSELPYDEPEIADLKASKVPDMYQNVSWLITSHNIPMTDTRLISMIGPTLVGMVFNNFRLRKVIQKAFNVETDDEYDEMFIKVISTLFLSGIKGISERLINPEEDKNNENG